MRGPTNFIGGGEEGGRINESKKVADDDCRGGHGDHESTFQNVIAPKWGALHSAKVPNLKNLNFLPLKNVCIFFQNNYRKYSQGNALFKQTKFTQKSDPLPKILGE